MKPEKVHIIGAGIAGLSAATAFDHSTQVTIYEKAEQPFFFSSSRNAAIARSYEADPHLSYWLKFSLQQMLKVCDCNLIGNAPLLIKPLEVDYYENDFTDIFETALISRAREFKTPDGLSFSGREIQGNGVLDIEALKNLLLKRLKQSKTEIKTRTLVHEIFTENRTITGISIKTDNEIKTIELNPNELVINAGGAWATLLQPQQSLPLIPHKRHLYYLTSKSPVQIPILWDETREFYIRNEGSGYLASHCDETPARADDYEEDPEQVEKFLLSLNNTFPAFNDARIQKSWACLRTFSRDGLPVTGFDATLSNLFWVAGLGGRGMSISMALPAIIENLLKKGYSQNESELENPFTAFRFY